MKMAVLNLYALREKKQKNNSFTNSCEISRLFRAPARLQRSRAFIKIAGNPFADLQIEMYMLNNKGMELRIEKGVLIKDKQAEFNAVYPYLRIEFFKSTYLPTDGIKLLDKLGSKLVPIGSSERFSKSATISIEDKTTAYTLEKQFLEKFDLSIKLFRKSGSLWIETTLTENWSLEKQNEEGEFMSSPIVHKKLFGDDAGDEWMEKE